MTKDMIRNIIYHISLMKLYRLGEKKLFNVLNKFIDKGYKSIVVSNGLEKYTTIKNFEAKAKVHYVADARSSAFYAFGLSKMEHRPTILIVDGNYLSNIYTGLTEAWFQKIPIIIFSLNDRKDMECDYLNSCLVKTFSMNEQINWEKEIENIKRFTGPILIKGEFIYEKKQKYQVESLFEIFDSILDIKDTVLTECSMENKFKYNIKVVGEEYKYGIISKYDGYTLGTDNRCILVSSLEAIALDTNIFNNRYINSKMKMIFVGKTSNNRYTDWMRENKIQVFNQKLSELNEKIIRMFINLSSPAVLILNI